MPKTNHNRNFVDERDYSVPPGDWTCGKHGAARNKRGLKKYKNSRARFKQNQQLKMEYKASQGLPPFEGID